MTNKYHDKRSKINYKREDPYEVVTEKKKNPSITYKRKNPYKVFKKGGKV